MSWLSLGFQQDLACCHELAIFAWASSSMSILYSAPVAKTCKDTREERCAHKAPLAWAILSEIIKRGHDITSARTTGKCCHKWLAAIYSRVCVMPDSTFSVMTRARESGPPFHISDLSLEVHLKVTRNRGQRPRSSLPVDWGQATSYPVRRCKDVVTASLRGGDVARASWRRRNTTWVDGHHLIDQATRKQWKFLDNLYGFEAIFTIFLPWGLHHLFLWGHIYWRNSYSSYIEYLRKNAWLWNSKTKCQSAHLLWCSYTRKLQSRSFCLLLHLQNFRGWFAYLMYHHNRTTWGSLFTKFVYRVPYESSSCVFIIWD